MSPTRRPRRAASRLLLAAWLAATLAACGDGGGPSDIDGERPAAPELSRVVVVPPVDDGVASVVGSAGAVAATVSQVRVVNPDAGSRNGSTVEGLAPAAADGGFLLEIEAELGDDLVLTAIDGEGRESQPATTNAGPQPTPYTGDGVGDVQLFPLAGGGALALPFATGQERFVLIAQSLNPTSADSFDVRVTAGRGTGVAARTLGGSAAIAQHASPEARIRALEREVFPILSATGPARAGGLAAAQQVGDERDFFVINRTEGIDFQNQTHFDEVMATLRFLGDNTEIWVDNRTPAANVPASLIDAVGQRFDEEIYFVDREAFGEESDVDGNGRVIILLTPTVNALNTDETVEQGLALLGFFFGPDLLPRTVLPFSNEADIFFALVPDPTMEFSPLEVPIDIEDALSAIFAHEFEHMISANQHILVRTGQAEQVWLDEGLAHSAETLNGFHRQNRLRSALFLDDPENTSLVSGDDTLERRGAAWLLVQYMVDRFGEQILGQLVQTRLTGIPNVESVTDRSMMFLFHEWASALFLDGLSQDPLFHFPSLDLRAEFQLARNDPGFDPDPPLGQYLGVVGRLLGADATTTTRDVDAMAAAYYEITANGPGTRPVVLSPGPGANLQAAVFRVE